MPVQKVKVLFTFSVSKQGWTETYYIQQNTLTDAYNVAFTLAQARALMIAAPAQLDYIRCSLMDGSRNSTLTNVGPDGANLIQPNDQYTSKCGQAQDCALITLYASGVGKQRPLYCHGFPDDALNLADPNNADKQLFQAKDTAFRAILTNGQWYLKYHPTLTNANAVDVSDIDVANNLKQTEITMQAAIPGLAVGDYIELYAVKGLPARIGIQRVQQVTQAGLGAVIGYTLPQGFTYQQGAKAAKYAPDLSAIDNSNFNRFTTHKVGRPFGASAGRRRSIHP